MNPDFEKALHAYEKLVAARAAHNAADNEASLAYNAMCDGLKARYVDAVRHLVPEAKLLVEIYEKTRQDHHPYPIHWAGMVSDVERHDVAKDDGSPTVRRE